MDKWLIRHYEDELLTRLQPVNKVDVCMSGQGFNFLDALVEVRCLLVLTQRFFFRDGAFITAGEVAAVSVDDIVRLMVGRDVEFVRKPLTGEPGEVMLSVQDVSRGSGEGGHNLNATVLRDMSIDVRAGEIVGFAGLVGAGRTELARVIFGADGCDEGIIYVNGRQASPFKSPRDGIAAGLLWFPRTVSNKRAFYGIRSAGT